MKDYTEKKTLLYSIQEGRCLACGKEFSINNLTIDHILPKKRGKKTKNQNPWWVDEIFNLRLLCLSCHLLKRPHGFREWDIEKIDSEIDLNYTGPLGEWIDDKKTKRIYKQAVILYKTKKIFLKK